MNTLKPYSTQYHIKRLILFVGITLAISCIPIYQCGVIEETLVVNNKVVDKTILYELVIPEEIGTGDTIGVEICNPTVCSAYSKTTYGVNGIPSRYRIVDCNIERVMNGEKVCVITRQPPRDNTTHCEQLHVLYRGCNVYNLTDTTCLLSESWYSYPLKKYCISTTNYDEKTSHQYVLNITDEMLGEMQKDYSMLEKFPEYYGKKR